jgi:uncharacterized protein
MSNSHRLLLKWARYVHVYLTMFGLLVILFFTATGFILNHPSWFGQEEIHTTVVEGNLPTTFLEEPDKLAIVEILRQQFGVRGALESFEIQIDGMVVRFRCPGCETDAVIRVAGDRRGQTTVTHHAHGILGLLTDLHRGEASGSHTGEIWSLVIDSVAILLFVVSATGLILWTSLRSRGKHGLAFMGLGLAMCIAVYWFFVP